jgi:polysaccharide biosynthesis/export protein
MRRGSSKPVRCEVVRATSRAAAQPPARPGNLMLAAAPAPLLPNLVCRLGAGETSHVHPMRRVLAGALICSLLADCSALPASGPTVHEVLGQVVEDNRTRFDLVDVDSNVVATLLAQPHESFAARFKKYGKPPDAKIGIGDAVSVTIWEAAAGGLFGGGSSAAAATGATSVTIPTQFVGQDGAISVPYAGRIPVAGRTPPAVQQIVEQRLADKAIEPQTIVTIVTSVTNTATVSGEVINGARLQLSLKGDGLLDLIAEAGGAKAPVYQIFVRLSRDGITATIPMDTLVSDPAENIYAWPGDVLTLIEVPETFSVLGATGTNARLNFTGEKMTLVEAVAAAGGLNDALSDPSGVFLFRYEPAAVIDAFKAPDLATGPGGSSPVLFRLDLSDAHSYFLAQRFPLEDKDVIYVADAQLTQIKKFFDLISDFTGPVLTGVVIKNNAP